MSMGEAAPVQRRALVDRLAESCLAEIDSLAYASGMPYSKKTALLDATVHTCLSTLPTMFTPLAKHPATTRLFLAMLEEHYSDVTGVPLPHDFSKIMSARAELADCLRRIATALVLGKLNVVRAPTHRHVGEEELDELSTIEAEAREEARRGSTPVVYTAEHVKDVARSIDALVRQALTGIDLVDGELAIEEAVSKSLVVFMDDAVRRFVEKVIGEDPVKCIGEHTRKYSEAKQADSRVSAAASWVDRIFEDYTKCVEFSVGKPPCDVGYIQDQEVCARAKCAVRLITLIPATLERLGLTTIVSQVVTR